MCRGIWLQPRCIPGSTSLAFSPVLLIKWTMLTLSQCPTVLIHGMVKNWDPLCLQIKKQQTLEIYFTFLCFFYCKGVVIWASTFSSKNVIISKNRRKKVKNRSVTLEYTNNKHVKGFLHVIHFIEVTFLPWESGHPAHMFEMHARSDWWHVNPKVIALCCHGFLPPEQFQNQYYNQLDISLQGYTKYIL